MVAVQIQTTTTHVDTHTQKEREGQRERDSGRERETLCGGDCFGEQSIKRQRQRQRQRWHKKRKRAKCDTHGKCCESPLSPLFALFSHYWHVQKSKYSISPSHFCTLFAVRLCRLRSSLPSLSARLLCVSVILFSRQTKNTNTYQNVENVWQDLQAVLPSFPPPLSIAFPSCHVVLQRIEFITVHTCLTGLAWLGYDLYTAVVQGILASCIAHTHCYVFAAVSMLFSFVRCAAKTNFQIFSLRYSELRLSQSRRLSVAVGLLIGTIFA